MEESALTTRKFFLTFGVLFGLFIIIFSLMLYSADMQYESGAMVQSIQYGLLVAAIILGIYQFKKANIGSLSLKQGIKIGVGVAFIGSLIMVIYSYIFATYIEPEFLDNMFEIQKIKAMEANPSLTLEQMDQGVAMQKKFAWVWYPSMVILFTIFGLIIGLVAGLIMKKEKSAY
ncbi:MAG: DUF4199 domain-containing protein [Cellulophaga sp.]|nr:DUF4199 domain-containing protein [Cellulophaga sp.]